MNRLHVSWSDSRRTPTPSRPSPDASTPNQNLAPVPYEVVRYFNEAEQHRGHQDHASEAEPSRTLGWHLGRDVLDFLQATNAALDVDEYDADS